MSKGLGSTFSVTQQVHQHLSKHTISRTLLCEQSCLASSLCLWNSYYCTIMRIGLCMYIVSHTIYYAIYCSSTRNSKSSLLSAGGISYWERSACDLCVAPGGDSWHIPYFLQKSRQVKYHCYWIRWSWISIVTCWDWMSLAKLRILAFSTASFYSRHFRYIWCCAVHIWLWSLSLKALALLPSACEILLNSSSAAKISAAPWKGCKPSLMFWQFPLLA